MEGDGDRGALGGVCWGVTGAGVRRGRVHRTTASSPLLAAGHWRSPRWIPPNSFDERQRHVVAAGVDEAVPAADAALESAGAVGGRDFCRLVGRFHSSLGYLSPERFERRAIPRLPDLAVLTVHALGSQSAACRATQR